MAEIADAAQEDVRVRVHELIERGSGHALDQAAQTLEDGLGRHHFVEEVRRRLATPDIGTSMSRRLQLLKGIPFRAILTTNFDGTLDGLQPSPKHYARVLRPGRYRWWEEMFWKDSAGALRIKLHGDAAAGSPNDIVLTRLDYRRRLYGEAGYMTFLRAAFSTSTVLFLGCSFEDAYLNELRSEVLSLLGHRDEAEPLGFAVLNDVSDATVEYFRRHEGIHVLSYDSRGGVDWRGFDAYLERLFDATNPLPVFGKLLAERSILWVDAHPQNNRPILDFFARAAAESGNAGPGVSQARNADEALTVLRRGPPFDLVITHWGEPKLSNEQPVAVQLLRAIRYDDIRCPVLVFAAKEGADERKPIALSLGAQAYCHSYGGILRRIWEVFERGSDRD